MVHAYNSMQEVEAVGARYSKSSNRHEPSPPLRPFVLAKVSLEGGKVQVLWLSRWKELSRWEGGAPESQPLRELDQMNSQGGFGKGR